MDTSTHATSPAAADDRREDDPDPEPQRRAAPIEEHHFQRPVVSPIPSGVRRVPRGG
jgi:hypothetical protein